MSDLKKELREAHFKFGDVTPNYRSHARDTMVERVPPIWLWNREREESTAAEISLWDQARRHSSKPDHPQQLLPNPHDRKPEGPNLTIQENLKSSIEICPKNGKLSSETTNGL